MIVPGPDDIEFRISIAVLFALTLIVRSYCQVQSLRSGKSENFESPGNAAVRSIAGVALLCGIAVYVFRQRVMVERFGSQYRAYMERTGRFLPKLKAHS